MATASFALTISTGFGQIPDLPGWDLVWNDEFDGPNVDVSAWELLTRKDSFNNEKQYYLPEQITINNGNLRITATDEPFDGKDYRSGRMWTWEQWTYGRFEARMDLPTTQGMWPAFWLNPRGVGWPTGGEIDIMENRGSEPFKTSSAYHWGSSVAAHQWVSDPYTAIDGTGNYADLKLEYYSEFGASHGSADFLGETVLRLEDGDSQEDIWTLHELLDESPPNAVEARVTLVFLQPGFEGGSVHFDNALLKALPTADFDGNGTVDSADLLQWESDFGASDSDADFDGDTDGADFLAWQRQLGSGISTNGASSSVVPEPTSCILLMGTVLLQMFKRHTIY